MFLNINSLKLNCLQFVLCLLVVVAECSVIEKSLNAANSGKNLDKLLIDERSNRAFIAATNTLYIRSLPSLQPIAKVSIGPKNDSLLCPPNAYEECICSNDTQEDMCSRSSHDSIVKAMLYDRINNQLIVCTDRYYGYCLKVFLRNYNLEENHIKPVVSNSRIGDTILLTAVPGDQMFVASSLAMTSGLDRYKDMTHMLSKRRLRDFSYTLYDRPSFLDVRPELRHEFPLVYEFGFVDNNFSFVMGARRKNQNDNTTQSFIGRLCNHDDTCRSYVELQLRCATHDRLVTATLANPGSLFGNHLGLEDGERLIFAVFVKSEAGSLEIPPTTDSAAICVFPLKEIIEQMDNAVKVCHSGIGNFGPSYIREGNLDQQCVMRVRLSFIYFIQTLTNHKSFGFVAF